MPAFERAEYLSRIERVKTSMREAGIDVLLASHPANMNYLTGYDGWSYYVHQLVALSLDADEPVWIGREMDAAGARLTAFLRAENLCPYTDVYVDARDKHCMHHVAAVLADRGWDQGAVGVEMDAWYFTARAYVELERKLPRARLVDAWPLVNWVRIVKSPAEIEMMRAAGAIVSRAMGVAMEVIDPGVRECDAVAKITEALISGTPEHWGDYPATLPHCAERAQGGGAAPHVERRSVHRKRRLQRGAWPAVTTVTMRLWRAPCFWASRRTSSSSLPRSPGMDWMRRSTRPGRERGARRWRRPGEP